LKHYRLPATVYVTTYYSQHQNPIFRLAVQYIYWATRKERFDLSLLHIPGLDGEAIVDDDAMDPTMWKIIDYGETRCDEAARVGLASKLAEILDVNLKEVATNRQLSIMSEEEIRAASVAGIDIQLHTHRHRFPTDDVSAKREVVENRAVLERIVG